MEVARLRSRPSVLIVDQSAENREVLKTALAGRGTKIWEAEGATQGFELARRHHPDVIVLDLEIAQSAPEAVRAELVNLAGRPTPIVLLGTAKRVTQNFPTGQFVAKPYHYGPLIRKIEELLAQSEQLPAEGFGPLAPGRLDG